PVAGVVDMITGFACVAVLGRDAPPESAASASGIPSRTVMTFAQFLQRILRILPRTRSSPIEYLVLHRSHRNFTPTTPLRCGRHGRMENGQRGATRGFIVPKNSRSGKGVGSG